MWLGALESQSGPEKPGSFLDSRWSSVHSEIPEILVLRAGEKSTAAMGQINLQGEERPMEQKVNNLPSTRPFGCGLLAEGAAHIWGESSHIY